MFIKLINTNTGKKIKTVWFGEIPLPSSMIRIFTYRLFKPHDVDVYGMQFYETEVYDFFGFKFKRRFVGVVHAKHNGQRVQQVPQPIVFKLPDENAKTEKQKD